MNEYEEFIDKLLTSDKNFCLVYGKNIADTYTYVKPNMQQILIGFDIWLYADIHYNNFSFYYNLNNQIQFIIHKSSNTYIIFINNNSIICNRLNIDTKTYESIQFNNINIHGHTYRLQLEEIIKFIN